MTRKPKTKEREPSREEAIEWAIAGMLNFAAEIHASKERNWSLLSHVTMTIKPDFYLDVVSGFLSDMQDLYPDEYKDIAKAMGKDVRH